jgi:hypothetical protein
MAVLTKTDWSKITFVCRLAGTSRRFLTALLIPFTTTMVFASAPDFRTGM